MAIIFALWAQCDTTAERDAFARHFDGVSWPFGKGKTTICQLGEAPATCAWVIPTQLTDTGIGSHEEAADCTEVGHLLYAHLATAPPFSMALVGLEVDDDHDPVASALSEHDAFLGLVVRDAVWERVGKPARFVRFSPGMMWRPYQGEALEHPEQD